MNNKINNRKCLIFNENQMICAILKNARHNPHDYNTH